MSMNSEKLIKIIELIVKKEVKKQLSILITKELDAVLPKQKVIDKLPSNPAMNESNDLFELANEELLLDRNTQTKQRKLCKDPILNEILNKTTPFNKNERMEQPDDKTVSFDQSVAQGGVDALQTSMESSLGLNPPETNKPKQKGMGVSTGLPGLDKILNRDNSELVKKFKKNKIGE